MLRMGAMQDFSLVGGSGFVWGVKEKSHLSIKEISKYVFVVCFGFDPFDGKVIH